MATTLYTKVRRLADHVHRRLHVHHDTQYSTRDLLKRLEQMLKAEDKRRPASAPLTEADWRAAGYTGPLVKLGGKELHDAGEPLEEQDQDA
jgi:hypothetical protein